MDRLVPTVKEPRVVVPIPPLVTAKTPETSEVKEAWPLNKEPPEERTRPVPKDDKVVEPLAATVNKDAVLEEATLNGFSVPVPWTLKETVDDVALTPATLPLSFKIPVLKVLVPLQTVTKPATPPLTLPPPPLWSVTQARLPEASLCKILLLAGKPVGQK